MGTPPICVIVNPHAAGGRALKTIPRITSTLTSLGVEFNLTVTTGPCDALHKSRELAATGAHRILAVGGDGTFNEVANGILESGHDVVLGIVPSGTGCDLPRSLGLASRSIEDAVRIGCTGEPMRIDVGYARCDSGASRYFVNVAGLGFDAVVADRAAHTKLPGGKVSYLTALATSLASYHNIPVTVTIAELAIETKAVFVTIANARFFGGGFKITPMADLTDGKLDLAIIGDLSIPELLRNIPSVYRGTHTSHPKFTHAQITHARIESSQQALVQIDGELLGYAPAEFSVKPMALSIAR